MLTPQVVETPITPPMALTTTGGPDPRPGPIVRPILDELGDHGTTTDDQTGVW